MRRKLSISGVALGVAIVAALVPATASAEETKCRGSLGAVTVDNLKVPEAPRAP